MFFIMFLTGMLSTMNVWVTDIKDIRFSLNDVYMSLLMCGWMYFFMGIIERNKNTFAMGLAIVIFNIWAIRSQFLISESQYKLGMIPHHSMAILMSKQLLKKQNNIQPFLKHLINTQTREIAFMKD